MSSSKNKPISKSRSLNKPVRLDRGEDVGGFSPVIPQSTEKSRSKSPSQIGDRKSTSASKSLEKQASQSVASGSAEKPRSKSPSVTPRPRVASPPPAPPSDLMQSSGTTPRARSNSIARGKNISKMRNSMFNESAPSPATRSLLDQSQPSTGVKKGTSTRNLKGASGGQSRSASPGVAVPSSSLAHAGDDDEDNAEDSSGADRSWWRFCCCKTDPIMRLVKVLSAFPFIIIVASLDLSTSYSILRSPLVVRAMNLMIYVLPGMVVYLVLAKTDDASIQRIAMFFYISLYLLPVGMNVMYKLKVSSSSSKIEEGTFCFKPARSVRMSTTANIFAMSSIVMEWMQHCLYVLPLGIVSSRTEPATLSSFPPYLPFLVYYWGSVISVFICALIVILNAVLKGKAHYRLQRSDITWYFLFNFAGSLYVTVVTILFMGFWCARDGGDGDYVLVQDPRIVCWETDHLRMAVCGLVALAIYLVQNTLLPAGTFKETMRDNDLEIMFVPVYLQAHFFLKAIFCGIYVSFYFDDWARITTLTVVNLLLLGLSNAMKPCSVEWVNLLRDTFFMHASLSGLQALNYLLWPISDATTGLLTTTLASNILFVCIVVYIYYINTARSIEYEIAKAFLDLEWQVSRGGFVHPRVLEPLICLTLSTDETDWEVAKKYIGQMVWLISYPNMRVQFQSAWGIANLALCDNDSRIKIHESGGTKALFEWYLDMEFVVQLEALAALTNLTLSEEVCDVMVSTYGCIPFFLGLAASSKLKHSQFATIAVGNIAKVEKYREAIRKAGGVQILVGCIMSHDYSKRRYGCLALANLALSNVADIAQVFESPGLIDRIIKMALRKEIETQKEVTALVRNLTCHIRLRPLLLERGVMQAVQASKTSVYAEVREWCDEITYLLQSEVTTVRTCIICPVCCFIVHVCLHDCNGNCLCNC